MNTRRSFIHGSLAASAGVLAQCSGTPDRYVGTKPGGPHPLIIDSHCHIFNAEDMDTYGYIMQGTFHPRWQEVLAEPLILLVKSIFLILRGVAPGMERENWLLDAIQHEIDKDRARYYGTDGTGLNLEELKHLITWFNPHTKERKEAARAAQAEVDKFISGDCLHTRDLALKKEPGFDPLRKVGLFLARLQKGGFIDCMANYRIHNALHLMERYPDVDLFIAATLDNDAWFPRWGPKSNQSELLIKQAQVMKKISLITNGRILHRTGYCPLHQIIWERTPESQRSDLSPLQVLKCSVKEYGSVGAKLYPVLGYRPTANGGGCVHPNSGTCLPLTNEMFPPAAWKKLKKLQLEWEPYGVGKALDTALREFYEYCVEADCSVMAHTIPSHGYDPDTDLRSGPDYWETVLHQHPKLRLDLGHFGDFGGKHDQDLHWSGKMAKNILSNPHLHHAYADISCLQPGNLAQLGASLARLYETFPATRKRVMYGTDWHENLFPCGAHHYLGDWSKMFATNSCLTGNTENFFVWNAARFLGLAPKEKVRSRLGKLLPHQNFDRPLKPHVPGQRSQNRWDQKLDALIKGNVNLL